MLSIDLTGKNAFVAGVADDHGFGWAICRALAAAGATVRVGTWPPALGIFLKALERDRLDMSLPDGGTWAPEKIYPMDAVYDTPDQVTQEVRDSKRYAGIEAFTISEVASQIEADLGGEKLDILVHSLANGPEVTNDLIETSREGYLAALSASSFSLVSMVQRFGPIMAENGSVISLSYLAGERTVPGYGGGMSTAKAALESDTRTNTISAGPLASRAAKAIGTIERMVDYYVEHAPIQKVLKSDHVGGVAAFLASPLSEAISGETLHVDMGYHSMGLLADLRLLTQE